MATKQRFLRHLFGGGWATDYGPVAYVGVDSGNHVTLPWLNEAENVIFELDGGPHLAPGSTKNNSSALESGANITGVFDAWFSGAVGTPTQHRILNVGTKIKKDNANNTFTDLFTGMTAGAVPYYCMLEDLLVMSNNSGTDVAKSWDGTTAQNLAGSPPIFGPTTVHKNRIWASGDPANPSRLYYCVDFTPADWAGAGSGYINIDPSDGDVITGHASFRNELWVFKGPRKGSIHRILGSAPTGDDPFSRQVFFRGLGSVGHNTIVPFADDLAFMWSDGTIRTIGTTANFGGFETTAASRPINKWIREHVTKHGLTRAMAVDWPEYGILLFVIPIDASTVNSCLLMMDYRFSPPRWSKWSIFSMVISLGVGVDASKDDKRVVLAGCNDGYLRTLGAADRSLDGTTPIKYNVISPFLDYQLPSHLKTLDGFSVIFNPKNAANVTFGWTCDSKAQLTQALSQGGVGALLDSFLLDTDMLAGGNFYEAFHRPDTGGGGVFRTIQFQVLHSGANEDVEVHGFGASISDAGESYEDQ